jgi:hypothetical protein
MMKRLAVLSFSIALLSVSIEAQAQQYPVTIEQCYAAVQRDYGNCTSGSLYPDYGLCRNRAEQALVNCQQGVYVPPGGSPKDQCLQRVLDEYKNCGYRAACQNRWIQGLQECG